MRRAYVFRLRPTARQHVALAACVDAHRELYNAALQERRDAWSQQEDPDYLRGSIGTVDARSGRHVRIRQCGHSHRSRPRCAG